MEHLAIYDVCCGYFIVRNKSCFEVFLFFFTGFLFCLTFHLVFLGAKALVLTEHIGSHTHSLRLLRVPPASFSDPRSLCLSVLRLRQRWHLLFFLSLVWIKLEPVLLFFCLLYLVQWSSNDLIRCHNLQHVTLCTRSMFVDQFWKPAVLPGEGFGERKKRLNNSDCRPWSYLGIMDYYPLLFHWTV